MDGNGAWVKIGRVKRSDLPIHVRMKLPKGKRYQLAAFIPSDNEVGEPDEPIGIGPIGEMEYGASVDRINPS